MNVEKLGGLGVTLILCGLIAVIVRAMTILIITALEKGEIVLGAGVTLIVGGLITVLIAFATEYRRQESTDD